MIGLNFLLVSYRNGARRTRMVHSAEGPLHRHRYWNLSSLQGLVSSRCKGNDCSQSRAFWRSTSRKNKMVWKSAWKTLEITVSHCILSDKQCTASNVRQCATSSFTPSTFLLSNNPCCAAFFSTPPVSTFLVAWKNRSTGKNRRIGDNFGISALKKLGAEGNWYSKKSLWTLLMKAKTKFLPAHDSHVRVPRSSRKNSPETVCYCPRNFWIVGCFVYSWLCCLFPGNIASNAISRSLGRSGWFIASQRLSYPSRIGTSPWSPYT